MSKQEGTVSIGSSLTISKSLFVPFPIMFINTPALSVVAEGSFTFPDRFSVLINKVDGVGFDCTVKRYDQQTGWAQDPTLTWEATGEQVPEVTGSLIVGSSTTNEKTLRVKFDITFARRTPVVAWVVGDVEFPDRFSATVRMQNIEGFECTVRKTDGDGGWGQSPTLYWNSNGILGK
ncbi:uncharacterized protein LOC143468936 [Clavelina lepadiformis]|uniref:uncharacterized protein LOC143468936 n=1 Tax=Clavelina lepadiformis TaxID=159417 RepID=UPI00404153CF